MTNGGHKTPVKHIPAPKPPKGRTGQQPKNVVIKDAAKQD